MTELRARDLTAVLALVGDLNEFETEESFPPQLLVRLAEIIPADGALFNEHDLPRRVVFVSDFWGDDRTPAGGEEFEDDPRRDSCQYVLQHPISVHRRRTGYVGALADSDFYPRRARLRHEVVNPEFHSRLGIVDAVSVEISSSASLATLWLESCGRDFSERDKLVFDVIRPHLEAHHRNVWLRRLLAAALAALQASPERAGASAVVLIGLGGRVEFVSDEAQRLFGEYFGESGHALPRAVEEWRRAALPSPFTKDRDGHRLVVDAVGPTGSALLVREEAGLAARLTVREWDVIRCVDAGMTNAEVARLLWITPSTVKKHLEHVYAKLGVRTRTAALNRLRPRRPLTARSGDTT